MQSKYLKPLFSLQPCSYHLCMPEKVPGREVTGLSPRLYTQAVNSLQVNEKCSGSRNPLLWENQKGLTEKVTNAVSWLERERLGVS